MTAPGRTSPADPSGIREAFAHYPAGVAALAACVDGVDTVLVASSFTVGVSLDPALVLFAVQRSSTTWPILRNAGRIGVSVLAQGQEALCRQLAAKDKTKRWNGIAVDRTPTEALFLRGSSLLLECRIHAVHTAGDHDIVVLEVVDLRVDRASEPLVFHGSAFRQLARVS